MQDWLQSRLIVLNWLAAYNLSISKCKEVTGMASFAQSIRRVLSRRRPR
jgi:hypothetical protein